MSYSHCLPISFSLSFTYKQSINLCDHCSRPPNKAHGVFPNPMHKNDGVCLAFLFKIVVASNPLYGTIIQRETKLLFYMGW